MKKVKPIAFVVTFLVILMLSCNPLRHYYRVAEDTEITDAKKSILSSWVNKAFPDTTPTYIQGETVTVVDSSFNQEAVDSLQASLDSLRYVDTLNIDSLKQIIIAKCKPKTKWITNTRVDTIIKIDSALAYALADSAELYKAKADGLKAAMDAKGDNGGKLTLGLILGLMVTGMQAYIIYNRNQKKAAKQEKKTSL